MIKNGTHPHKFDSRDHSLFRTFPYFGSASLDLPVKEYTFDNGSVMQDQDQPDFRFVPPVPPIPYGCTGETSTDICADEDKVTYDPKYTYDMTCMMEGHDDSKGCDIRNSLGSLSIYGLRKNGETALEAVKRKRGKYFIIDKAPGRDWFDSFRLAMRKNGRSISVGVPWFSEWGYGAISAQGILRSDFVYDGHPEHYGWHNVKVCGEVQSTSVGAVGVPVPLLRVKPWQGEGFGNKGWVYWDRETFNRAYDIYGTFAATPGPSVRPEDVEYIKATIYQQILIYLNRMLALIGKPPIPIYA